MMIFGRLRSQKDRFRLEARRWNIRQLPFGRSLNNRLDRLVLVQLHLCRCVVIVDGRHDGNNSRPNWRRDATRIASLLHAGTVLLVSRPAAGTSSGAGQVDQFSQFGFGRCIDDSRQRTANFIVVIFRFAADVLAGRLSALIVNFHGHFGQLQR